MANQKVEGRLNEHLVRVKAKYPINYGSLERGMIIETRYKGLSGGSKRQVLVVLNAEHLRKTHCLSLDKITFSNFNRWVENVGVRTLVNPEILAVDIPILEMTADPRSFYKTILKATTRTNSFGMGDAYRTFFTTKLRGLQLLDYKFNSKIEEQWRKNSI